MKARLRSIEANLSRLETADKEEAMTARYNLRGWASEWVDGLPAETRVDLLDASLQRFRLEGVDTADGVADKVIVEARLARYLQAEQVFVDRKVEEHLAATSPADRARWRRLYREARIPAATGSDSNGSGLAGTGARRDPPGP